MRRSSGQGRVKIVCVGNRFRRDDGAAHRVADLLEPEPGVEVVRAQAPVEILNHVSSDIDTLIVVDAMERISEPGRIHRLNSVTLLSDKSPWRSTHTMTLPEVIRLLESLGAKPSEIIIFGIEGESFEPGVGLSESVERSCAVVASEIKKILGIGVGPGSPP
ncbi:MAG: hydrogenase maturation protease [Nitrososphaerota archaeon]